MVLAADHLFGEIPLPDTATAGWQDAAASLAPWSLCHGRAAHYWSIPAMSTHLIHGAYKARFDEQSLNNLQVGGVHPSRDRPGGRYRQAPTGRRPVSTSVSPMKP
ncbi:hypothetical protein Sme01_23790 [Sphaerisporangium melleum]|uniref:Uncharacterized protein n=1 Tax=Sphaerisporangium melleum TaxID=321316 RepID=A0A917QSD6_9ACTN|nr:hypothetical protein [Sphaerisporangium melleum]GGK65881.1 hypothetical protein GCM10007964_06150 [Sphaerisporangium melleum]GII69903.1 hypothetical protein Sme01_23790 [Sphaerisporangium melleum]